MAGEIVRCPHCGQANRVPELAGGRSAVCGKCKSLLPTTGGKPVIATDANFSELVSGNDSVVVDFWAPWCGPCRQFAPVFESVSGQRTNIRFAKLNVDENQRTAAQFKVASIPTLLFFSKGELVGRQAGAVPRAQFEQSIERYLGK